MERFKKISFVSVENGIASIGFRKMAAMARSIHPNVEVCYVVPYSLYSPFAIIFKQSITDDDFPDKETKRIAQHLAGSDMVCFSSMTPFSELTKRIIVEIRILKPDTYIVWGGIHPIVYPEDAVQYADAVCVGEGESAFTEFISNFNGNNDFTRTRNFWFNINGDIIRNGFLPLHTPAEMERFPHPLYAENELIYKIGKGFVPCGLSEYLSLNNLAYTTVWSIGCPYKCIYCSNSKFIENDSNYRKIRYPSVDYIVSEAKHVLEKHPHVSTICFHDDSFMAIPFDTLEEFAVKWREKIRIPFHVAGLIPSYVRRDKIGLLVWAGMNRVRMGIQSGSDRILNFYRRPNRAGVIQQAAAAIADFTHYMIPPAYDIIVDNPVENRQDVIDTLNLIYNLPRPFTLNIYSLRIIPNTELAQELSKLGIQLPSIRKNYLNVAPTIANIMVYMLVIIKPPYRLFRYLLRYAKPMTEKQRRFPFTLLLLKTLYYIKRALNHLFFMDFSVLQGKFGFLLWKTGIIGFYQNRLMPKYPDKPAKVPADQ